jgi:hypothetical protein
VASVVGGAELVDRQREGAGGARRSEVSTESSGKNSPFALAAVSSGTRDELGDGATGIPVAPLPPESAREACAGLAPSR